MRIIKNSSRWRLSLFFAAEGLLLAVAALIGGPPWTLLAALAIAVEAVGGASLQRLGLVIPSLVGPCLFRLTGDRRLFFPYAIYLAAHVAMPGRNGSMGRGVIGGGLIVAAFLAVRVAQRATPRVLAVEAACGVAIVAGVVLTWAGSRTPAVADDPTGTPVPFGGLPWRLSVAALAALAAAACVVR